MQYKTKIWEGPAGVTLDIILIYIYMYIYAYVYYIYIYIYTYINSHIMFNTLIHLYVYIVQTREALAHSTDEKRCFDTS